ncbi:hypothetical protein IRY31_04255 [Corynebacterium afermentans subsp. lipophilum]|uniref:hypothetical protein n=1 Tax=Corynebacterium afermentans TaxID=38286 RepID=UPI00188BDB87|nr:hypothetical protein [Corynebacterium afermentans]MBF4547292.1 hypothetical protein [Corynebacterium afermentans subsp. lipophilum]WJY57852.1 hypothetical protein CAFEL_00270 [Corynebacterium afermentans subsp. lipophilum]
MKIRTLAMTATLAGTVALAPTGGADAIDDALAKMPSGPISCDQASRYWTNDADYQQKVRQARAIAAFDRRGPQILDALSRVDEAANRCGLKGTQGGAKPAQNQPKQNTQSNQQQAQPKQNTQSNQQQPKQAQNPQNLNVSPQIPERINLAPAGAPTFDVPVANITTLQLPDIIKMIQQALAQILAYFNIQL